MEVILALKMDHTYIRRPGEIKDDNYSGSVGPRQSNEHPIDCKGPWLFTHYSQPHFESDGGKSIGLRARVVETNPSHGGCLMQISFHEVDV
jgi:hypothetical protein